MLDLNLLNVDGSLWDVFKALGRFRGESLQLKVLLDGLKPEISREYGKGVLQSGSAERHNWSMDLPNDRASSSSPCLRELSLYTNNPHDRPKRCPLFALNMGHAKELRSLSGRACTTW